MGALRMEVPVAAGVVSLKPEGLLLVGLEFDETSLIASFLDGPHVMLSDGETKENSVPRPVALRYDDIRRQDAQLSRNEAAAVLEQGRVSLLLARLVQAALRAVDVGEIEPGIGDCELRIELTE